MQKKQYLCSRKGFETISFMKKLFLALMLLMPMMGMAQEANDADDRVFVEVEKMPEFPGGQQALLNFLKENVKYPEIAKENGIQGRVICQFVVAKNGAIEDVKVLRSGGDASLDKEALRVIKAMPNWQPGWQDGKPVRTRFNLPIIFKL